MECGGDADVSVSEMKVEMLYFEGCPHLSPTMERVREALVAEAIDAAIA